MNKTICKDYLAIAEEKYEVLELMQRNLDEKGALVLNQIREEYQKLENKENDLKVKEGKLDIKRNAIAKIISEKTIGFPWLAKAISEFEYHYDIIEADYLFHKSKPAKSAAEKVKEFALEKKIVREKFLLLKNYINYYESLFPWIKEYVDESIDESLIRIEECRSEDESTDPVKRYLSHNEYMAMSSAERNHIALNRYLKGSKTNWQIGRDYERYIGYLYEKQGYEVEYVGIVEGYNDLGRDLICRKDNVVKIVQCKLWSSKKVIREKHINQLFGTTIKFKIDNQTENKEKYGNSIFPEVESQIKVVPVFVTSTQYSETAKKFAEILEVELIENRKLGKYPLIKCNMTKSGGMIYHLPFDQQYDNTKMLKTGSFYAESVDEAESKGFRRAFRWRGKE